MDAVNLAYWDGGNLGCQSKDSRNRGRQAKRTCGSGPRNGATTRQRQGEDYMGVHSSEEKGGKQTLRLEYFDLKELQGNPVQLSAPPFGSTESSDRHNR